MDVTTCKLVQHAEDSEACVVLKFTIEHFYAVDEDNRFFQHVGTHTCLTRYNTSYLVNL
jgi:hypothetical protein